MMKRIQFFSVDGLLTTMESDADAFEIASLANTVQLVERVNNGERVHFITVAIKIMVDSWHEVATIYMP